MLHRLASRWTGRAALVSALALAMTLFNGATVQATASATTTSTATSTVKVWVQTMDSCRQAIPGASFSVKGNNLTFKAGPGKGSKATVSSSGNCPLQRGNCSTTSTGCVSFTLPVPSGSSKVSYTGKQTATPSGYVPCNGGSACKSETFKFTISSSGAVSGTVKNVYPDGTSVTFPSGGVYSGTQTDPIVIHNFQLGNGSCDGDHDLDDHLTGSPSVHCDNDSD